MDTHRRRLKRQEDAPARLGMFTRERTVREEDADQVVLCACFFTGRAGRNTCSPHSSDFSDFPRRRSGAPSIAASFYLFEPTVVVL
jgi:hypothetical protein